MKLFKLLTAFFALAFLSLVYPEVIRGAPQFGTISANNNSIPKYEKYELTFPLSGITATNYQLPFVPTNNGNQYLQNYINIGISVDALFLPPGQTDWTKAHRQPGFYYQSFDDQVKDSTPWFYPLNTFSWKVRFAPNQTGAWQYKLVAEDAGGRTESSIGTFTVTASANKGFIKVSPQDKRYFEFEDGTYFTGLGYNLDLGSLYNDTHLQTLANNKINFIRAWIQPFNIWSTSWDVWELMPGHYDGYLPRVPILPHADTAGGFAKMRWYLSSTSSWYEECAFLGHQQPKPAVKTNTNYFVRAKYKTVSLVGPRVAGKPYGVVIKAGGWAENPDTGTFCANAYDATRDPLWAATSPLTTYGTDANWNYVVGSWNSGTNNFLPNFYMALENASSGVAYLESVEVFEMTGGTVANPTLTGANLLDKPSSEEHLYMAQRPSYKMDKIIDKLKANDVYVRLVILEVNEYLFKKFDPYGSGLNDDDINLFYGDRTVNAARWFQMAWWRYLQARWGYSTQIHSWELVNEGDPNHGGHYLMTDELGKYMHCGVFGVTVPDLNGDGFTGGDRCLNIYDHPNDHMVSTSFWHSFPGAGFWGNTNYPNVDFADIHAYEIDNPDAAGSTIYQSTTTSNLADKKPVIRGETAFGDGNNPNAANLIDSNGDGQPDSQGLWLHKMLWGQLNPGGMYDPSSWWPSPLIYGTGYDYRPMHKRFSDFVSSLMLNNGKYVDVAATSTNTNIRVVGQKDTTNQRAHLWIDNKNHTWKNVADGVAITPVSGTITFNGFTPNTTYPIARYDTYTGQFVSNTTTTSDATGTLTYNVQNLTSDFAVKIGNYTAGPTPTSLPTPTLPVQGDADNDRDVDFPDLLTLLKDFGRSLTTLVDWNHNGTVDIYDFNVVISKLL